MKRTTNNLLIIETYTVPQLTVKTRLQDLAPNMFSNSPTKSGLKKAIKNNLVKINGVNAATGTFLIGGEKIDLYQKQQNTTKPSIQIALQIIYEDAHLALVNKPAGITVSGNKKWTLENALASNLKKSSETDALTRPEPIHRLDHPTSGILLIGKTSKAVIALNKMFEEKTIQKTYYAVTIGKMKIQGSLNTPIDNKPSATDYKIENSLISERFEFLNLLCLTPHSGRKHQIRKHLSEQGNPILGDSLYGIEGEILKGNGLYLHAYSLCFIHPITKEKILYTAPLTKKFTRLFPEFQKQS
jgi:23S rRNA pseudouridine1911/1915/1917 synthase